MKVPDLNKTPESLMNGWPFRMPQIRNLPAQLRALPVSASSSWVRVWLNKSELGRSSAFMLVGGLVRCLSRLVKLVLVQDKMTSATGATTHSRQRAQGATQPEGGLLCLPESSSQFQVLWTASLWPMEAGTRPPLQRMGRLHDSPAIEATKLTHPEVPHTICF